MIKLYVYAIENTINNNIYVGATERGERRLKEHKCRLNCNKHCNKYLQNDYNKYGKENFKFYFIDIFFCNNDDKFLLEEVYTKKYGEDILYNYVCGSQYTKKGIEMLSGCHIGVQARDKHPMFGKKHTDESREKMSKSLKQAYSNNSIAVWNKGKKCEQLSGGKHPQAKKVICITTNEIFDCIEDAHKKYKGKISECCKGNRKHAGKLSDGTKLKWMFLSDYNELLKNNNKEIPR